jgi:outer membrane immunogenic protein
MNIFSRLITGVVALIVTPAFAADMAVKAPPPAPASAAPTWTGFYIGANGGYGWKDPTVTFAPNDIAAFDASCGGFDGSTCPAPASFSISGGLGGLQAGYNWQVSQNWLVGFETDFDWSGIRGTGTSNFLMVPIVLPPGTSNFQVSEDIKWFGTIRARLGFLPASDLLVYATGGLAYGRVDENVSLNSFDRANLLVGGFSFNCSPGGGGGVGPNNCFVGGSSRTMIGWTAGTGVEYLLWRNVSLKAEYLFVDLGGHSVNTVAQATLFTSTRSSFTAAFSSAAFNVARAGVNWKF